MQPTKRGFTLIELLVVVAIITILAAMLLPVLGRARLLAQEAVCMNNKRQLALAALSYTGDHEDHFPAFSSLWWTCREHSERFSFDPLIAYGAELQLLDSPVMAGQRATYMDWPKPGASLWPGASVIWWGGDIARDPGECPGGWCANCCNRGWDSFFVQNKYTVTLVKAHANVVILGDLVHLYGDQQISRVTHPRRLRTAGWSGWGAPDPLVSSAAEFQTVVKGSHEAFADGRVEYTPMADMRQDGVWFLYYKTPPE
jgi:prepilin-type N-terminal cleavage/methylation domain-containing protein